MRRKVFFMIVILIINNTFFFVALNKDKFNYDFRSEEHTAEIKSH